VGASAAERSQSRKRHRVSSGSIPADGSSDSIDNSDECDLELDHGSGNAEKRKGIQQAPDWNVDEAYKKLQAFLDLNDLEEVSVVPGDGNCFFHAAIVVLVKVRPELRDVTHEQARAACVAYVYNNRQPGTEDLLRDLGFHSWEEWKERMGTLGVYCDYAMVEALAAV
jgi:hypothetical protein